MNDPTTRLIYKAFAAKLARIERKNKDEDDHLLLVSKHLDKEKKYTINQRGMIRLNYP